LFLVGDGGDDGSGPIIVARARDGPIFFAVFGFERGDEASFFGSDDHDERIFVKDGSGAVAELIGGLVGTCSF